MTTTTIRNLAITVTAVVAAIVAIKPAANYVAEFAKDAIAQEVQIRTAETARELRGIKALLRADTDREEFRFCMDYDHQDMDEAQRRRQCEKESDQRQRVWLWEDCMSEKDEKVCGPKP